MTEHMKAAAGEPADIAPFGEMCSWTGDTPATIEAHRLEREVVGDERVWRAMATAGRSSHLGIEWECMREFERVEVTYAQGQQVPARVKLQYWQHYWPQPYRGGWTSLDDPYNGHWVSAQGDVTVEGYLQTFRFDPLDITELRHAADYPVTYRAALKVRLLFEGPDAPAITRLRVFGRSVWREADLVVEVGCDTPAADWSGCARKSVV